MREISLLQNREDCRILGIPFLPEILDEDFHDKVQVVENNGNNDLIDAWIERLRDEYDKMKTIRPKIIDNFEELQNELQEVEELIYNKESQLNDLQNEVISQARNIEALKQNIEIINNDISNNKDSEKLRKLGSELECQTANGFCPVCHQSINDTLLPGQHEYEVMSIEQNIKHLAAQKEMLEYALKSHKITKDDINNQVNKLRSDLIKLQRLAKTIRNDLYSINEELSETIIYKRMNIAHKIENLQKLKIDLKKILDEFMVLSEQWKNYLTDKENLPKDKFTQDDKDKLFYLQNTFKGNLEEYRYTSISNINNIEISNENYLPVIEGFDMKFDSSASDNIRAIWAYTMALLETSLKNDGNHFGVLIFDEPAQHSIGSDDMIKFFDSILGYSANSQVIIGITINNEDIKDAITKINKNRYHMIKIGNKAFVPQ